MPDQITAYRVFVASPGGLREERRRFRDVLNNHNEVDALERSLLFIPVGWEVTLGGVGRPQKLINEDLRRCDYFVMLLWDRWGSAPQVGQEGPFASGSEEEFNLAWKCYEERTMRDIIIFFKALDPQKVRDPGKQLDRVLRFRQELETHKNLLFEEFEELAGFENKLKSHLANWVRHHEKGLPHPLDTHRQPAEVPRPPRATVTAEVPDTPSSAAVRGARELVNEGHLARAEIELAKAVVAPGPADSNLDALNRYGALLVRMGKLLQAEDVFQQLSVEAQKVGNEDWQTVALRNLARVYIARDQPADAERSLRQILEIQERAFGLSDPKLVDTLNELGEFYHSIGRYTDAEAQYSRAIEMQGLADAS